MVFWVSEYIDVICVQTMYSEFFNVSMVHHHRISEVKIIFEIKKYRSVLYYLLLINTIINYYSTRTFISEVLEYPDQWHLFTLSVYLVLNNNMFLLENPTSFLTLTRTELASTKETLYSYPHF